MDTNSCLVLQKDLEDILNEFNGFLTSNTKYLSPVPPFKQITNVGELSDTFPILVSELASLNLTIKSLHVYTVFYAESIAISNDPFIVIPIQNYEGMKFAKHELIDQAEPELSPYTGSEYYKVEDAVEVANVSFYSNSIYFINSNIYTSSQYPENHQDGLGTFLTIFVNEDLSSYFT